MNKSICVDIDYTRYKYEMSHVDGITQIPRKLNLTYPGTETDSSITSAVKSTMPIDQIAIVVSGNKLRRLGRPLD